MCREILRLLTLDRDAISTEFRVEETRLNVITLDKAMVERWKQHPLIYVGESRPSSVAQLDQGSFPCFNLLLIIRRHCNQ